MLVTIFIVTTIVSTITSTHLFYYNGLLVAFLPLCPLRLFPTQPSREILYIYNLYHITLLFKNLPKICDYTLKENSHFLQ